MKIFMFPAALGIAAFASIRQVFWLTPFPLAFPTLSVSDFLPADLVCLRDVAEKHQQPVSLNRCRGAYSIGLHAADSHRLPFSPRLCGAPERYVSFSDHKTGFVSRYHGHSTSRKTK